jgi:putative endonuclease
VARVKRPTPGPKPPAVDAASGPAPGAPRLWSIYLLRCADGTLYAGATNDIDRRLAAHRRGGVKYTRGRLPVELWWIEEVGGKGPALSREAALKRKSRAHKLALGGRRRSPRLRRA